MRINTQAASDARHASTGKDGAIFNTSGTLLASMESFQASVAFNNAKYSVMGDPQEHEALNTFGINITMSEVVIEDNQFIEDIYAFMEDPTQLPDWNFQGMIQGLNKSEERVVYRNVIPSGNIDLQNVTVGDVVKRAWNFFVNGTPKLQSKLTVDR